MNNTATKKRGVNAKAWFYGTSFHSHAAPLATFKSANWKTRDYESTNIVACVAEVAPTKGNWIPCNDSILGGLTMLWIESGVRYYGYL